MVESQPQTPAVMKETYRKDDRYDEEDDQHGAVFRAKYEEANETDEENHEFTHDDVH
jgi:hypothetical protein